MRLPSHETRFDLADSLEAVCPVVWEGWRREASPIPIFGAELPALQAKRQVSPPKLTFESASFE
jgi:hypothetical protein